MIHALLLCLPFSSFAALEEELPIGTPLEFLVSYAKSNELWSATNCFNYEHDGHSCDFQFFELGKEDPSTGYAPVTTITLSINAQGKVSGHSRKLQMSNPTVRTADARIAEEQLERGEVMGIFRVAIFYHAGIQGYKKDMKKALELYKKACELGLREACDNASTIAQ